MLVQVEFEAVRIQSAPDRLADQPAIRMLHQLEGAEPVEMREGRLTHQLLHGFTGDASAEAWPLTWRQRINVAQVIDNFIAKALVLAIQVDQGAQPPAQAGHRDQVATQGSVWS